MDTNNNIITTTKKNNTCMSFFLFGVTTKQPSKQPTNHQSNVAIKSQSGDNHWLNRNYNNITSG